MITDAPTISIRPLSALHPDAGPLLAGSQAALDAAFPPEEIFTFSAQELAGPNAQFLVAYVDAAPMGCVALVDMVSYGEVKRLFVAPQGRGLGLGRALMEALERAAKDLGLRHLKLETGPKLAAAVALYRALGYSDCPAFGGYPDIPSNLFMSKALHHRM